MQRKAICKQVMLHIGYLAVVFDDDYASSKPDLSIFMRGDFVSRHIADIWNVMMDKIRDIHGDECARGVSDFMENTGCYSPCNMLIARKSVYDELCEWLFPVIFAVMDECGQIDDKYQNRYPGFLSERLINFFFYLHQDKYNLVYADKIFLK